MTKRLRGILAFLLVFVLFATMVPPMSVAAASDTADTLETQPAEAETVETTAPTEESPPPETSPPAEEYSSDDMQMAPYGITAASEDYGIMPIADTTSNVSLFDQASPNYTISISQLTIKYKPNGSGTTKTAYIKNIGWHFARYDGTSYPDIPLYCIEPIKDFGASSTGNYMDTGVTVSGSGNTNGQSVWYAMPSSYRRAIMLTLLYSDEMWDYSYSVKSTSKDNNPNTPLRLATQFIIYEIVTGIRNANTFVASGNGYVDGDIFYTQGKKTDGFVECYEALEDQIQAAMVLPSFVGSSSSNAPTIAMKNASTTLTDTNGVLSDFTFSNRNGASFSKSGNRLTITQTGTISPGTIFSCYRRLPSAENSAVALYYDIYGSYQTCVSLDYSSSGSLYGYFKLDAPELTGGLNIAKTTEDGNNLSGWQFALYTDSACTNLAAGPYTTNTSGRIALSGINAGTYYVKELGHSTASINALYTCTSPNPQKVTISGGTTASVSFYNKLVTGNVKLVKNTNTGSNLSGWQIGLYTDAACNTPVSGSPFTTGSDGTIAVTGLKPGTYYAKEVSEGNSYWVCDTAVKSVTVTANQTASVTFTNTHYGRIAVQKSTNTGNHLFGWVFQIRNSDGDLITELVTDENGYAVTKNLPLGRYMVQEMSTDDNFWQTELGFHDVTVKAGETVTDKWLNVEQGLGWFYKKTNTGDSIAGWEITLYSDEACTQVVTTLVTNEDGKAGRYLDPGIYYAKETGDTEGRFENEYWLVDETIHRVEIKPHEETDITFTNVQYGKMKIIKAVSPDGSLEGWSFRITDSTGVEITGSPFKTDADGTILTGTLLPGQYTVEELIPDESPYYCVSQNPQTVTVIQGQTAEVHFVNALRPGKIIIHKVDLGGNPLAGARFMLEWSEDGVSWFPVTYSANALAAKGCCSNPDVSDGCLTSGTDGVLKWGNLYAGLHYRLTEVEAPDGYSLLDDYAFTGKLPQDTLTVELRVVNCHGFALPETGSHTMLFFHSLSILAYISLLILSFWDIRRKELY